MRELIRISADDLFEDPAVVGYDDYTGYGRVNAGQALELLLPPHTLALESVGGATVHNTSGMLTRAFVGAPGVPDGTYYVFRTEVRKTITFSEPYEYVPEVWGRGSATQGLADANPIYGWGYTGVVDGTLSACGCVLQTFVYDVYKLTGTHVGWVPCAPGNAQFAYAVLSVEAITDQDDDGVEDSLDNCPNYANADQLDDDGDGMGNPCDCGEAGAWVTTPGLGDSIPAATAVAQMYDGGYLCAGRTPIGSSNPSHIWRITPCGDLDWVRELESPTKRAGEQQPGLYSPEKGTWTRSPKLEATDDGGFIFYGLVGDSTSLVKLDRHGDQVWTSNLFWDGSAFAVREIPGGGFVALQAFDFCLVKTDICGQEMWRTPLPDDHQEGTYWADVTPTSDGGFVVVSDCYAQGEWQWCIRKLTSTGSIVVDTTFSFGYYEYGSYPASVREASDGGIVVAGMELNLVHLVKYESLTPLSETFVRSYWFGPNAAVYDMRSTADGGYIIAGTGLQIMGDGTEDFVIVKTDSSGNQEWTANFGLGGDERALGITESDFGGYVVAGKAQEDWLAHLVKFMEPEGTCCLLRGDINHDGSGPDISDLTYLNVYMFQSGPEPPCMAEANVDGVGEDIPDIADLVYLVTYMFQEGPEPPPCP